MGADYFATVATGTTAQNAFDAATQDAGNYAGFGGYSGTIAEKASLGFSIVPNPNSNDVMTVDAAHELAETLADSDKFSDKWGPAGCIALANHRYLFFGWASS
jgi:hypothetical protein